MTQTDGMTAAAEVWRVDESGGVVALERGVYGSAERLRLAGAGLTLDAGVGLAGAALARRVPVLLDALDGESFERCEAAGSAGVTAAVALPVFDGARMSYVLVLMFRSGTAMKGAVELWAGRRGRFELGLTAGHYVGLERFGKVSRYVNFPMGSGLPGTVWQTAAPRVMPNLGRSGGFLRSSGAESAGLATGLGFPVIHRNELMAVMLWLSSTQSPLAKLHEVWVTDQGRPLTLERAQVESAALPGFAELTPPSVASVPAVYDAACERRPVVFEDLGALGSGRCEVACGHGLSAGVAIPVLVHDRVTAVALLAW